MTLSPTLERISMVLLATGTTATAATSAVFSDDKIGFVVALVATVGVVAAAFAWVDARIDKKVDSHAEVEERQNVARLETILTEISHLRELINIVRDEVNPKRQGSRG